MVSVDGPSGPAVVGSVVVLAIRVLEAATRPFRSVVPTHYGCGPVVASGRARRRQRVQDSKGLDRHEEGHDALGAWSVPVAGAPAGAAPAPVLDQAYIGPGGVGLTISQGFLWGQTFTAGKTGTLYGVNVDISGYLSNRLRVQIQEVSNGVPTGVVLGETVHSSSAPIDRLITFPTQINVEAGHQYAITASFEGLLADQSGGSWAGTNLVRSATTPEVRLSTTRLSMAAGTRILPTRRIFGRTSLSPRRSLRKRINVRTAAGRTSAACSKTRASASRSWPEGQNTRMTPGPDRSSAGSMSQALRMRTASSSETSVRLP